MNELIKQFEAGHTKMGGEVHLCQKDELNRVLNRILSQEKKVLFHEKLLEKFMLDPDELGKMKNIELINPGSFDRESWREKIRTASASVTNAVALIAFSGTVVISSALDHSRLFSLSPERNVVLVYENQIVKNLDEFWEKYLEDASVSGSQIVFVTGTSRTADIEKKLIEMGYKVTLDTIAIELKDRKFLKTLSDAFLRLSGENTFTTRFSLPYSFLSYIPVPESPCSWGRTE